MSIASEKIKFASERFLLVRINPARYIEPILNGGVYEITLPFVINTLERNGIALTKDNTTPSVNDHWYQDEDTKLLQVKLAGAPDVTTNVLIAYYYLFYTATIYRAVSEDPEDSNTPTRNWLPYIQSYPSILQSFDGITQGVFSINDTSIDIINTDKEFQNYLTDDDSFYNKTIEIWLCINNVQNIQKIFTGTIKNLSITKNIVTINCVDTFNRLKAVATFGDDTNEVYYSMSGFPDVASNSLDLPIPYIIGKTSRYTTRIAAEPIVGQPRAYMIENGNEAACTVFDSALGTSTNREWGACRQNVAVATQTFGAVQAVLDHGTGYYFVRFGTLSNINLGDTLNYDTTEYGVIGYVGNFTYLSVNYNCVLIAATGTFTLGSTVTNLKSFAVVIEDTTDAQFYYPVTGRDYTVDESTTTSGGNTFVKIDFVNSFESTVGIAPYLDPAKHRVIYRTSLATVETHGDAIASILDRCNIPYDAVSFAAADAALPVNAAFAVPNFDEQDYDTYLKYIQDILGSTLGFLKINSDFEVEYELLAAPSSSTVRDSSLLLLDETGIDLEYQDIQTSIIAYNPHNSSSFATGLTPSPSETSSSPKSLYLGGIENVTRFRHVLETITGRITAHIGLKSNRFVKYRFKTATEDIDSELGTDLELQNDIVLGGSEISDLKIITIEKSPKFIGIEASDLRGL